MILEVKQIGKFNDKDPQSEYGEYTMFPYSSRTYVITRGLNGKFKTGLEEDPETRKRLEEVLGKDLSPTSSFWDNYKITFSMASGSMKLNTENPVEELLYIVAKANYLIAPDRDTLKEDFNYKKNTIFYVHDEEALQKRKSQLQELKDEVGSLVFQMRNNKDKMLFVSYALGLFVNDSFKVDNLYNLLTKYREKLSTLDQLDNFRKALKTPNEELQAMYYVKKGLKHSIISFDPIVNKFRFQEKHIARNETDLHNYFKDKRAEADLAALVMEVKDREK